MTFKQRLMTMAVAGALACSAGAMAAKSGVTEADEERIEADYKAAKERCDTFAGDAKERCIADAKARFGIN